MSLALTLAAVLAAAAVVVAALPFLRDPSPRSDVLDEASAPQLRSLELAEERDRALAALKELEFDHRTGKVSDEDYRGQVGPLRARAAAALRAQEADAGLERRRAGNGVRMVEVPEPPSPPGDPSPPAPVPEPSPEPIPEPYPPPDEATPPEPARVPEPGPL